KEPEPEGHPRRPAHAYRGSHVVSLAASGADRILLLRAPVQLTEEQRLDLLGDGAVAGRSERRAPLAQRHHRLGHRAVPPGPADRAEQLANDVAGAAHVPWIAHRDDQRIVPLARHRDPLRTLELHAEIRQLRDDVLAVDVPDVQSYQSVLFAQTGQDARQEI